MPGRCRRREPDTGAAKQRGGGTPDDHAGCRRRPWQRATVAAAELVPGLVCFTTVGRLWRAPGALLLVAAAFEFGGAPVDVAQVLRRAWPAVLAGVLGVSLALVASTAAAALRWLGFGCGLAVAAAPWLASRSVPVAAGALLAGAVPFASITWWTAIGGAGRPAPRER